MNKLFSYSFIFIIIIIVFFSFISIPINYSDFGINENEIYISNSGFVWPIPSFYKISSYFGKRKSPTVHASSYHYGLDIPASENTYFLASISGTVTFTGFNGSSGYTIILENDNIKTIYCHVSPNFLVNIR